MTDLLREAIDEAARLPEPVQDKIGAELLQHIDKMHRLRAKLDRGIQSLDRGGGRILDIKEVIARARTQHGKA